MSADHQYNEKRKCRVCGKEYRREQLVHGICNTCAGVKMSNGKKCSKCEIDGVKLYKSGQRWYCASCYQGKKVHQVLKYIENRSTVVTRSQIAKEFGVSMKAAGVYMGDLHRNGQVKRERRGREFVYCSIKYSNENFRHRDSKKRFVGNNKKEQEIKDKIHRLAVIEEQINKLAETIQKHMPDEIGRGNFGRGESPINVAIRIVEICERQKRTIENHQTNEINFQEEIKEIEKMYNYACDQHNDLLAEFSKVCEEYKETQDKQIIGVLMANDREDLVKRFKNIMYGE